MDAMTLITGATSALGAALCQRLAPKERLILHGRDAHALKTLRMALPEPGKHLSWVQDLTDMDALSVSLRGILNEAGVGVKGFAHLAGLAAPVRARLIDMPMMERMFRVSVFSAAQILRPLLDRRVNHGALRSVVFISSIYAHFGAPGQSLYCAAKAALCGFMRGLAVECAPDVRVNAVLPGAFPSRMSADSLADPVRAEKVRRDYPLGIGRPESIAGIVEHLLSEDSSWVTGQEIVVDGGRSINLSVSAG